MNLVLFRSIGGSHLPCKNVIITPYATKMTGKHYQTCTVPRIARGAQYRGRALRNCAVRMRLAHHSPIFTHRPASGNSQQPRIFQTTKVSNGRRTRQFLS
jgi:hypothetical protein